MFFDQATDAQVLAILVWIHAAFIMVPAVALLIYSEMLDWKDRQPKTRVMKFKRGYHSWRLRHLHVR